MKIDRVRLELSESLIKQKENILLNAIHKIEPGFKVLEDLAKFGTLKIYPDGTEIFNYKGEDLIEFHKPKCKTTQENGTTKLTYSQDYRLLK